MLRSVSSLPISRRLFIAFALAAILPILMISFMGFYYVSQINTRGQVATLTTQAQTQGSMISSNLGNMYHQMKMLEQQTLGELTPTNSNLPGIDSSVAPINNLAQTIDQGLNTYASQYSPASAKMKPVVDAANNFHPTDTTGINENNMMTDALPGDWRDYKAAQQQELQLLQQVVSKVNALPTPKNAAQIASRSQTIQGFQNQIVAASQTMDSKFTQLYLDWNQVTADTAKLSGFANEGSTDTGPIVFGSIGAVLLLVIMILFIGFVVQRSISNPLTELVSLTRRISKGDTNARVKVESRDEISIVANSMNNMLDNIVHLIQDTQAQRDVLQGQVEKLVSEVSGVGEGDLRVQAEVTADALGVLADSFNYMVEELGSLVVRVKSVAREVEESTTMTSDRMNELVEAADRQIQQIASAAHEIEHMAQTSQQVANRAMALSSNAREARVSAQGGRQAVLQTIEGMGRISLNVQETSQKVQNLGESSREINNIVEALSAIAHQTNRLALDAAIQAAMAGENGKGFGAVAADIRRLAERAKEQATSVGRIVRGVRDEIGSVAVSMRDTERETAAGARLAEEAGTSLESIFSVIERQAREIDVINQMAMQQQQSSSSVVQIMQGVSEVTQESSQSTHEAAQNMERVARLAEQLLASVEAFKLRDGLNYFTPNATNISQEDSPLTISGAFRTVTATAQPISNGNGALIALPAPISENGFSQFSPSFPSQGWNRGQTPLPPLGPNNGQPFFSPLEPDNDRQFFAPQEPNNGGQPFFPPQGQRNSQPQEPNQGQQFFPPLRPEQGQQFFAPQEQRMNTSQPLFNPQGLNNGQQFFPPQGPNNGQQFFPQLRPNNGQPSFPPQGPNNGQHPFPPQGNRIQDAPQRPVPDNDWPSGNWWADKQQ